MSRRSRRRLRIGLVLILSLLFQQLAVAAYACASARMPAEPAAMSEHCAEMGMAVDMSSKQDDPALCEKHCNPDRSLTADSVKLSVPPLALPPLLFAPIYVSPIPCDAVRADTPIARSDPPPRLRYCSLLI